MQVSASLTESTMCASPRVPLPLPASAARLQGEVAAHVALPHPSFSCFSPRHLSIRQWKQHPSPCHGCLDAPHASRQSAAQAPSCAELLLLSHCRVATSRASSTYRHRTPGATATLSDVPTFRFCLLVQRCCVQGHRAITVMRRSALLPPLHRASLPSSQCRSCCCHVELHPSRHVACPSPSTHRISTKMEPEPSRTTSVQS
jgi:hypothetical protein